MMDRNLRPNCDLDQKAKENRPVFKKKLFYHFKQQKSKCGGKRQKWIKNARNMTPILSKILNVL